MRGIQSAVVSTLAITLASCGGGGSGNGVASTPPPPAITSMATFTKGQVANSQCSTLDSCVVTVTPLQSSPADEAGTFDTIALKRTAAGDTAQFALTAKASDLQIKVNPANGTYTMILDDGTSGKLERSFNAVNGFGNAYSVTGITKPGYDERGNLISPGGTRVTYTGESRVLPADSRNNYSFNYQWGLRHVSLGWWAISTSSGNATIHFVHGNRTPVSEVPTSGTATYRIAYSEGNQLASATTTLTADFASRMLLLTSQQAPERHVFEDGIAWVDGFDISATATIAAGGNLFAGPLSGMLIHYVDGNVSDQTVNLALAGQLSGGFFGPQAVELGAVWYAATAGGEHSLSGSFIGSKN